MAKKVEESLFEPAVKGFVDAGVFGSSVGVTMLWNAMQKDKYLMWSVGELIISFLMSSGLKVGRMRDITLGVEAGAIACILAPTLLKEQAKTTGARVTAYRPAAGGCPGCKQMQPVQPVRVSFPAAAAAAVPPPRGVSALDI